MKTLILQQFAERIHKFTFLNPNIRPISAWYLLLLVGQPTFKLNEKLNN